ncbi:MAG: cysteine desulfurase [Bacteroidota bacterium]
MMSHFAPIKHQFPLFQQHPQLVYLDSAATTQKPQSVIDALQQYYLHENANIHRGLYHLAAKATEKYEGARQKVQQFLHAPKAADIVFTRGATEAINLVAQSFAAPRLQAGDNILITAMEHHANLLPWQMLCKQKGAELRVLPMDRQGQLQLEYLDKLLDERTRLFAFVHISNTLGTINPIRELIDSAHRRGVPVLVDGAQSAAHYELDVQELDCDFLVCSGHKLYGPTGIGVLYGKTAHLKSMPPYQYGGDMIRSVSFGESSFARPPQRFEAGTPNIAGAIGLGAAIDFLQQLDHKAVRTHFQQLLHYAREQLSLIRGLQFIGTAAQQTAIVSFTIKDIHPHDIATVLGEAGIAVRAGHHCTQPIMDFLNIPGTIRASLSIYNSKEDIDRLTTALQSLKSIFA